MLGNTRGEEQWERIFILVSKTKDGGDEIHIYDDVMSENGQQPNDVLYILNQCFEKKYGTFVSSPKWSNTQPGRL